MERAFERISRGICTKKQVGFLDLLPVVRKAHREGKIFYYPGSEDHHWTALGHRIAAEAILQYLGTSGELPEKIIALDE
jgi:hypothetical protein